MSELNPTHPYGNIRFRRFLNPEWVVGHSQLKRKQQSRRSAEVQSFAIWSETPACCRRMPSIVHTKRNWLCNRTLPCNVSCIKVELSNWCVQNVNEPPQHTGEIASHDPRGGATLCSDKQPPGKPSSAEKTSSWEPDSGPQKAN